MDVHLVNIQNMCRFYLNPKKWIKNKNESKKKNVVE